MLRMILLPVLLLVACQLPSFAELPPSVYEERQKSAAEYLKIQVVRVDIAPGEAEGSQAVEMVALVTAVNRSAGGLTPGRLLTIRYTVQPRPRGYTGPGEVPILNEGIETIAYLNPAEGPDSFVPAAGVMSFEEF